MLLDENANENEEIYQYAERKRNGEDSSSIRSELINKGYSEKKVAFMMSEIDEFVVASYQNRTSRFNPKMITGAIITIIGIALFAIGFSGILTLIILFVGIATVAVRTKKRNGRIENSKWGRH